MSLLTTRKAKKLKITKFTHMRPVIPQSHGLCHFTHLHGAEACIYHRLLIHKVQTPSICSTAHIAEPGGGRNGILRGPTPLHYCSKCGSSHLTLPAQVFWHTEYWLAFPGGKREQRHRPGLVGCGGWSGVLQELAHGMVPALCYKRGKPLLNNTGP